MNSDGREVEVDKIVSESVMAPIDAACDRFEDALQNGQRPQIEDFLEASPLESRVRLLWELLLLELEYRVDTGECPDQREYVARFPDQESVVAEIFRDFESAEQARQNALNKAAKQPASAGNDRYMANSFSEQCFVDSSEATQNGTGNEGIARSAQSAAPRFPGFEILGELGCGGMGMVFKARHLRMNRLVAIKVLLTTEITSDQWKRRFEREMEAAAQLHHPNIVTAYDADVLSDGTPYLVMEYVDGEDLSTLVKSHGPMAVPDAVSVVHQAAQGLAYAHSRGIVHRDIKPGNLMRNSRGIVRILDMGLARMQAAEDVLNGNTHAELTNSDNIMGTVDFMAPEQALDARSADHRSDIYSLGCTLYFLLTGKSAYAGDTLMKKLVAHREQPPPSLATDRPDLPSAVAEIFQWMIAKRPEDRYQSTHELIADLEAQLREFSGASDATASSSLQRHESRLTPRLSASTSSVDSVESVATEILTSTPLELAQTRTVANSLADTDGSTWRLPASSAAESAAVRPSWLRSRRVLIAMVGMAITIVFGVVLFQPDRPDPGRQQVEKGLEVSKGELDSSIAKMPVNGWHGWPPDAPAPAFSPFNSEQAKQYQDAWAAYLELPVEYTNSMGMRFRLIPPGEFVMGSDEQQIEATLQSLDPQITNWQQYVKSEAPRHKVILTQPIYLSIYEVTQDNYAAVMHENPSQFAATGSSHETVAGVDTRRHPVERVSWIAAAKFCAKLSELEQVEKPFDDQTGDLATRRDGSGYRLPTEAEWEFACRAGTTTRFWIGDNLDDLVRAGWFGKNSSKRTHAVGELKPNPFGLYDMHGNVYEWVQDWWDPEYYNQFREKPAVDPQGPISGATRRVFRGGRWCDASLFARSSLRLSNLPAAGYYQLGFRVALSVDTVRQAMKSRLATDQTQASDRRRWPAPEIVSFNAEAANRHQEAWAKHLGLPVQMRNSLGMKFVLIPPGKFQMGSTAEEIAWALEQMPNEGYRERIQSEAPRHLETLSEPFFLGATEVTRGDFRRFVGATGCRTTAEKLGTGFAHGKTSKDFVWHAKVDPPQTEDCPVIFVSREDARAFCAWLSEMERRTYRLPTEAEWEYACRAGTETDWSFADRKSINATQLESRAHLSGLWPSPVGRLSPNPFSLFDMHGNVWEMCEACFTINAYSAHSEMDRSKSMTCDRYVMRGGSFNYFDAASRSAARFYHQSDSATVDLGFRVVLTIESTKSERE